MYVGAIDQGTSSTRFMVFNKDGSVVANHQLEHFQHYPSPGWVEHDPLEILKNTKECIAYSLRTAGLNVKDISAIGVTNQRETTVVWNKSTGQPYHNAIVWNDTRTQSLCDDWARSHEIIVRSTTGLPIASYFSASKLKYLLDFIPNLRADAESGIALFGTIDTWLIWNLTGGLAHVTDVTNASRTMLMDLKSLKWSMELLELFSIPAKMLPEIKSSSEIYGRTQVDESDLSGIPITGILGDQHAALVGQTCFNSGEAK